MKGAQPWPRWVCTNLLPDALLRVWAASEARPAHVSRAQGAGARQEGSWVWFFFFSTFVRPGDQPEVLCVLLEFLLADLLGLDQVKYPCREKHRVSDPEGQLGSDDEMLISPS